MEATGQDASSVMLFGNGKRIDFEAEIVEFAVDHTLGLQSFALLNN